VTPGARRVLGGVSALLMLAGFAGIVRAFVAGVRAGPYNGLWIIVGALAIAIGSGGLRWLAREHDRHH